MIKKLIHKNIFFFVILVGVILLLGRHLNPFDTGMFSFHDESQAARIQEYTLNLRSLQIPPRIAPDFSFHLGFPVFNFYAPTAYIITGMFHLIGIPVPAALKLSFLLAIIVAFASMYAFLCTYVKKDASLLGAILYVTCLYLPVDIFVRGNLAEVWFIALLPLALYGLTVTSRKSVKPIYIVLTVLIIHLLLTSHNILSLLVIPVLGLYVLILPEKKRLLYVLGLGLLSASYFFLPLIMEQADTYATHVATLTKYSDHFLCMNQLWQSPWGYGGSAPGCTADGMSFKLGKLQILLFLLGIGVYIWSVIKHRKDSKKKLLFLAGGGFALLTLFSLWMTTYQSQVLWNIVPFLNVIQFPWRFISLSMIGISFLGAYGWSYLRIPFKSYVTVGVCAIMLVMVTQYFYKDNLSAKEYAASYLSDEYISTHVAYTVAEYLPKTASYEGWRQFEKKQLPFNFMLPAQSMNGIGFTVVKNDPFEKSIKAVFSGPAAINIHYFPSWNITINNAPYIPVQFDPMGRPILSLNQGDEVVVTLQQTTPELVGDFITIGAILIAIYIFMFPDLWKNKRSLKT